MPSLGFLKKKRTKDSSQGSEGPTSPTLDKGGSPITPTLSKTSNIFSEPEHTQQTQQSHVDDTPQQTSASIPRQTSKDQSMGTQVQPSIQNLINQPGGYSGSQHDSAYSQHNMSDANVPQINAPAPKPTINPLRETKGKYTLADFQISRTLGTGSFGRVHLVQSKHNQRFYAVKVLKKAQVVKMKQVEHTNDERKMLQRCRHPFLITLWGTWQDSKNLYMVMDFIEGGELFSLLRKSQVRLHGRSDTLAAQKLTTCLTALPKSCRQVLRRRSHACTGLSPQHEHHLSRFEARESAARSTWAYQDYRFRLRKRSPGYYMDVMWYPGLSCA